MTDKTSANSAEEMYEEGMRYNWRQDQSLANSSLARALLERAARMNHTKAIRELAEMIFAGSGGPQNHTQALWLKWQAFVRGDYEALEELSDLLESYADIVTDSDSKLRARDAAKRVEEAYERLSGVGSYLAGLVRPLQ
jgi:TPR repeat protein